MKSRLIKETDHMILDTPMEKYRFFIRRVVYKCLSFIYKIVFQFVKPEMIKKKYYISICAIFKNEATYLEEWIEYHRIIGIDHFYLYNNFSQDDYSRILMPYIDEGIVTLTEWPVNQGQMSAYEDCADRFSRDTNWIAFIDLDEFIVPNDAYDVKSIIKKFERRPVVIVYWRYFTTSGIVERDIKNLVTEDFYVCSRKYANIGKIFFNTAFGWAGNDRRNKQMHSHWAEHRGRMFPPVNVFDKISWGNVDDIPSDYPSIQINHYVTRSYNEYMKKLERGDAYFAVNPRSLEYFYIHEHMGEHADYKIRKYLLELKMKLGRM